MQIQTTITQKGQITLPLALRKKYNFRSYDTVILEAGEGFVKVKPSQDIIDLAGSIKPKKNKPLDQARTVMEQTYSRP